jgi:hypothetical protein
MRPSSLYAADDEAREVTERLIRDAGYEPVNLGGLESARALEDSVTGLFLKNSPLFYRFAAPGRRALGAPQIGVGPVEPILSWGTEDVDIERRLERLCLMRHV